MSVCIMSDWINKTIAYLIPHSHDHTHPQFHILMFRAGPLVLYKLPERTYPPRHPNLQHTHPQVHPTPPPQHVYDLAQKPQQVLVRLGKKRGNRGHKRKTLVQTIDLLNRIQRLLEVCLSSHSERERDTETQQKQRHKQVLHKLNLYKERHTTEALGS